MRLSPRFLLALLGTAVALAALSAPPAHAQGRDNLPAFLLDRAYWSSRAYEKKAIMDGNEVGITFFNYGLLAGVGEVRGNWPLGSNSFYVGDVLPIVAAEVPVPVDDNGDGIADRIQLVRHVVSTRGPGNRGINVDPQNPSVAWTFEAKPGFASNRPVQRPDGTTAPNDRVALSNDPNTWPDFWPDQPTWIDPATGRAQWNGYFGRGRIAADLESYFWADDHNNLELQRTYPLFRADSVLTGRGGLGLEMSVRGLQWSQFLAQDAIFWLYEVTNNSTTTYPRVAVGLTVGTLAGGDGDSQDDLAFFDQANRIVYSWDFDGRGNQGQPVGYVGYGFLESPGNADNGIDDDGDGDPLTPAGRDVDGRPFVPLELAGTDNTFGPNDFLARTLVAGDPIITIDSATNRRSIFYVPATGSLTVVSQGREYTVRAGDVLAEATVQIRSQSGIFQTVVAKDLIDDDLDGLIDEDPQLHFERRAQSFGNPPTVITLPALRYKNFVGFARAVRGRQPVRQDSLTYGLLNPMIDEARDDGIDNDGDWNPATDDVGADGIPGTGDPGEGNGRPDDGEPNFDRLDVNESDQVGLTSFYYFAPSNVFPLSNDNNVWDGMTPGFFTTNDELETQQSGGGIDGDFVFGSGYFRLEPGQTLRFTLALVFGTDLEDITRNQITIQEIYDRNYQFARPPDCPVVRGVPGDGRVTIYWDSRSEDSRDPILGDDFQGYRVYKSTDPFFRDVPRVTDAYGNPAFRVPLAQFDRRDGIAGIYTSNDPRVAGVPFNLGSDTGLQYSYVDTAVNNGQRYYYAVTAYDSGSPDFYPAECAFSASLREDGTVFTAPNVVEVMPNAGAAGFQAGGVQGAAVLSAGAATGSVITETLDPRLVPEGAAYEVGFTTPAATPFAADSFFVRRQTGGLSEVVARGELAQSASVVFDGIRLFFNDDRLRIDTDRSRYLGPDSAAIASAAVTRANVVTWNLQGTEVPYDYEIRFLAAETSPAIGGFRVGTTPLAPTAVARLTNVEVYNRTLGCSSADDACPTKFVFLDRDNTGNGTFSFAGTSLNSDNVIIYEDLDGNPATPRVPTYFYRLNATQSPGSPPTLDGRVPRAGDIYLLATRKPFTARDRFAFTTVASRLDESNLQDLMARIRVVPNPYVAAASWERGLPPTITSGRGERRIDFIHLPAGARVRVYNVRGQLVRELQHSGAIDDGTVSWDLRTREGLETAYGVYFYHVEAPSGATRTGRLALIK